MKTFDVTLSDARARTARFGLLMYGGDNPPTRDDVLAALRRRGMPDKAIACMTWTIAVVQRADDFFEDGRIGTNRDR
jgi:hypothetical protein